ncbi:MAG: cache domain-containing protein [Desulfococcaceae bacterium]
MKLLQTFNNLPIRYKLLFSYTLAFLLTLTAVTTVIYVVVRKSIEENIESELKNSTATLLNMVRTSAAVSLKNYLRAVSEKNRDIAQFFYLGYKEGILPEDEARIRASQVLLNQQIGKSGYIYCIDSSSVLRVHPKNALIGADISEYSFAREQGMRKNGYLEYEWKNPGESHERPKALYMTWFEPWDWIISVTAYREEFSELVKVDDFRESVLSLQFGKTGYSYVMDLKGNLIIHPKLEGENVLDEKNPGNRFFIQEILKQKNGKIIYSWKNPEENYPREKLVIFNHIPEFDWIVASSSYLDELYTPLRMIRNTIFITLIISLVLLFFISLRISASITEPLRELMKRFFSVPAGDFTVRIESMSHDEAGQLAGYFNSFMERLETYSNSLRAEISERRQAEQALRLSEEMFSKAFSLSPNGLAIISWEDRRFINVNASFLRAIGSSETDVLGKHFSEITFLQHQDERDAMFATLEKSGKLRNYETGFVTKKGENRLALISGDFIELWNERCILATLEDITDIRRLEERILDIGEKERQKIGQDLHDDLCPHLIGIEVLTKVLQHKLERASSPEAAAADSIRNLIKDAIRKTRAMARGLCPVHLVEQGFEFSLEELAKNTQYVFGILCEFRYNRPVVFRNQTDAIHLFYITQEAVYNAIKHGRASRISIDLLVTADQSVSLKIIDDGTGISDVNASRGMGLRIMNFRAKKIGASFDIQINSRGGTTVGISFKTAPANPVHGEIYV